MNKLSSNEVCLIIIVLLGLSGFFLSGCSNPAPTPSVIVTTPTLSSTPFSFPDSTVSSVTTTTPLPTFTVAAMSVPTVTGTPLLTPALEVPTPLPVIDSNQLLPHNGLFIRRNNNFGTRPNGGIDELISQGRFPALEEIRYDDFVGSEQIPPPQLGQSVSVNYGLWPIPILQKRDARATHYLEIAIKTTDVTPTTQFTSQEAHPVVNYVFVVDTSGSMEGEKLDSAITSVRELILKMRETDIVAIVGFNDSAYEIIRAKPVSEFYGTDLQKINGLIAIGETNLNAGLEFGLNQIQHGKYLIESTYDRDTNVINEIFLFSDGNPTAGQTDWLRIRNGIAEKTRENVLLSTFAIGPDANTRELNLLAGSSGGTYTDVPDILSATNIELQLTLEDELNRRNNMIAIDVQIQIKIEEEVDIIHFYGHDLIQEPAAIEAVMSEVREVEQEATRAGIDPPPSLVSEDEGIRVFVPNLAVDETYWLVLELAIPNGVQSIGSATIGYADIINVESPIMNIELTLGGTLSSDLVVQHALGFWTSEVLYWALEDINRQNYESAKIRIENHISGLENAALELESTQLFDDVLTLRNFVSLINDLGYPIIITDESNALMVNYLNLYGQQRDGYDRNSFPSSP